MVKIPEIKTSDFGTGSNFGIFLHFIVHPYWTGGPEQLETLRGSIHSLSSVLMFNLLTS